MIARVCCCDLAIGVLPVLDPVYLEYITKNKKWISFYPEMSMDGRMISQVARNRGAVRLTVLSYRILIARPIEKQGLIETTKHATAIPRKICGLSPPARTGR
jgi:hypothetical protein